MQIDIPLLYCMYVAETIKYGEFGVRRVGAIAVYSTAVFS